MSRSELHGIACRRRKGIRGGIEELKPVGPVSILNPDRRRVGTARDTLVVDLDEVGALEELELKGIQASAST
jgi:hypothetical protein